ncbi:DUF4296 domain-containing protein [Sinomicrobium weinanense]|uniref:DUF4296 domain-containing protein n=1 Tax=Sinomicrobium weinanense TaxID=2842200 RepID=A0A926JUQ0_9FLAO|nr:DUF4296 domain-containing protein [Sinomicrobium weinanense]MBC9797910.1 DUF4296 domain-containing protein [Sinomicrobium weinanense]MBU3125447.1 DUF4296 domain-containing protein [Sinomicrobium weinanense]
MKLKHILWGCIFLLGIVSCKDKTVEKPDNLISQKQMTDILLDIALLNAVRGVNTDKINKDEIVSEKAIYQKYGIDSLRFVESNTYYASKPTTYASMYEEVQSRLEEMKEEFEKAREDQRKSDSIQKAKTAKGEQVQ